MRLLFKNIFETGKRANKNTYFFIRIQERGCEIGEIIQELGG
jgi:hypothetical protein